MSGGCYITTDYNEERKTQKKEKKSNIQTRSKYYYGLSVSVSVSARGMMRCTLSYLCM